MEFSCSIVYPFLVFTNGTVTEAFFYAKKTRALPPTVDFASRFMHEPNQGLLHGPVVVSKAVVALWAIGPEEGGGAMEDGATQSTLLTLVSVHF